MIDTTQVGGSSYEFQTAHALRDIAAGKASVAVLSYGSTAASQRTAIGTGGGTGRGEANWQANMEVYRSWFLGHFASGNHAAAPVLGKSAWRTAAGVRWPWRSTSQAWL